MQPFYLRRQEILARYIGHLDDLIIAINGLSTGVLSPTLISPKELSCYIKHVQYQVKTTQPDYELAMTETNDYYDAKIVSFVVTNYTLLLNIPVFLKEVASPRLTLHRITTTPIPADPADVGPGDDATWKGTYTKIEIDTDYVALTSKRAALLTHDDLDRDCTKLGVTWYCLNPAVIKYTSEHSCVMALHMDNPQEVNKFCKIQYLPNYTPKPTIMMDSTHIMFVAMPLPWTSACRYDHDTRHQLQPSSVVVMELESTCWCDIQMGEFTVHPTPPSCNPRGYFPSQVTKFTFNAAISYAMREQIEEVRTVSDTLVKVVTEEGEKAISGTLLTHQQIDLSLPETKFLTQDGLGLEQQNLLDDLPLKQVVESLKTGQPMFTINSGENRVNVSLTHFQIGMLTLVSLSIVIGVLIALCGLFAQKKNRNLITSGFHSIQTTVKSSKRPSPPPSQFIQMDNLGATTSTADLIDPSSSHSPSPSPYTARRARTPRPSLSTLPVAVLTVITLVGLAVDVTEATPLQSNFNQRMGNPSTTSRTEEETAEKIDEHWVAKVPLRGWAVIVGVNFAMSLAAIILTVLVGKIPLSFRTFRTTKTCPDLFCQVLKDSTDIYLQVGTMDCPNGAKVYLGSLLGPPMALRIEQSLGTKDLLLFKGMTFDILQINWRTLDMSYQGRTFYLPDQVKLINPLLRNRMRHYFDANRRTQMCNLVLLYDNSMVIRYLRDEPVATLNCAVEPIGTLRALPPTPLPPSAPPRHEPATIVELPPERPPTPAPRRERPKKPPKLSVSSERNVSMRSYDPKRRITKS